MAQSKEFSLLEFWKLRVWRTAAAFALVCFANTILAVRGGEVHFSVGCIVRAAKAALGRRMAC